MATGTRIEDYTTPAGFWIRVGAWLIDGWIFTPIIAFGTPLTPDFTRFLPIIILGLIYKPFMECIYGATLGKMVCGIRVIDRQGDSPTLFGAYVRFLPFLLSKIVGFLILFRLSTNSQYLLADMIPYLKTFVENRAGISHFLEISALSFPELFMWIYEKEVFFWLNEKLFVPLLLRIAGSFVLIDCVAAAFNYRKRALHDRIAGSFCIHKML